MPTRLQLIQALCLTFMVLVFGRSCIGDSVPAPRSVAPAVDRRVATFDHQGRSYVFTELATGGLLVTVNGDEVPSQVLENGQVELKFKDGLVERFGYNDQGQISLIDFSPPPPPPPTPKPKSRPKPKPAPSPPPVEDEYRELTTRLGSKLKTLMADSEIRRGWSRNCGNWVVFIAKGDPRAICFADKDNVSFLKTRCYYTDSVSLPTYDRDALLDLESAVDQCHLGGVP